MDREIMKKFSICFAFLFISMGFFVVSNKDGGNPYGVYENKDILLKLLANNKGEFIKKNKVILRFDYEDDKTSKNIVIYFSKSNVKMAIKLLTPLDKNFNTNYEELKNGFYWGVNYGCSLDNIPCYVRKKYSRLEISYSNFFEKVE